MNLLMLDSGAYSVWASGASIDIEQYIAFCEAHPGVTYYVNLDSIPGKPGDAASRTGVSIEESCRQGWRNYQRMIKSLPVEKVIAVYHRGEESLDDETEFHWLEKYIEAGVPYIGIGQTVRFGGRQDQKKWLNKLRKHLFDGAGRSIVKTHGFALTSFDLMSFMPWHSVDSTSWLKAASYGNVYVPFRQQGNDRFDIAPFMLNCSPKSPSRHDPHHISTLTPSIKEMVDDYFARMGIRLGAYEVVDVPPKYKRQDNELWFDKTKTSVMRVLERGVVTCHQHRFRANARFIYEANKVLPVDHIYFAGGEGSIDDRVEYRLKRRLMSYHAVGMVKGSTNGKKAFLRWEQLAAESAGVAVGGAA